MGKNRSLIIKNMNNLNIETAQQILNTKAEALRKEAEAYQLAADVLAGKYAGELVSVPALAQENVDKTTEIENLKEDKKILESDKKALIEENKRLTALLIPEDAKTDDTPIDTP